MSTHTHATAVSDEDRRRYGRRAQLLAGASVTYNVIEAVIAITAGLVAGSIALVGFGLDSVVEVSSGLIILWQFRHRLPESRERTALRLMAVSFFALAAYVTLESARALATAAEPEASTTGITLACASLVIMPFLSWSPTPPKRCCAPTCPPPFSPASSSTPPSAGTGPTRSPAWSSPFSPSKKAARHGAAKGAARPPIKAQPPTSLARPIVGAPTRRPSAPTCAAPRPMRTPPVRRSG
jgi:hypothetical protein